MKKYKVIWNNTSETQSGCVTTYATNEMGAIANARNLVQIGNEFRVVNVYEVR